jgi:DNA-binding PadR family transcriptional regulator
MADTALNSTAAALLGLLHERPMTGGELVAAAKSRFGAFWTVTRSQVYRELPDLASRGYVREGKPTARSAQPYAITANGKKAFARWLAEPAGRDHHRSPLLLRSSFAGQATAAQRRELFNAAREQHETALAELREQQKAAKSADKYQKATLDFAITYERSLLKWMDTVGKG